VPKESAGKLNVGISLREMVSETGLRGWRLHSGDQRLRRFVLLSEAGCGTGLSILDGSLSAA